MYICIYTCVYTHIFIDLYVYQYSCEYTYIHIHTKSYICTSPLVYVYSYMNLYIYKYICIYIYLHIHVHMYIHKYIHISIYVNIYTFSNTFTYMYIYIYTNKCIFVYICTYIYTYMYLYTYVYIYIHIYICMYIGWRASSDSLRASRPFVRFLRRSSIQSRSLQTWCCCWCHLPHVNNFSKISSLANAPCLKTIIELTFENFGTGARLFDVCGCRNAALHNYSLWPSPRAHSQLRELYQGYFFDLAAHHR